MKSAFPQVHPRHPNSGVQVTKQTATTTSLLKGSSAAGAASMFNNSQNTYIAGGSFSITTDNTVNERLDALYRRAAPRAILNAGGRADQVRCHPGTRTEVLGRIEKWKDSQDHLTPPIFWLSGPAGAGKTAIVQTIAERCKAQKIPQANFFFFRTDPSRNSLPPLVATLVHQMILFYPNLRVPIASVISNNPLILDAILEDQLMQLIVTPLQDIRRSSPSYALPLFLIDGLDECESDNSQRQILHAFDQVLAGSPRLFRLLVASRDEYPIRAAFNDISCPVYPLYLDGQYSPESDIRVFVNDKFKRVRKTHPLAHTLHASWPSIKDVEGIVKKSSGQFIYAATVMRFILDSSASPMLSLARVQGAAQISTKSPFSHLDAIYTYILSQADDQEAIKDILHAHFLIQKASQCAYGMRISHPEVGLTHLLELYNPRYSLAMIYSCLADLTSIAHCGEYGNLFFHHASFPDYLLDRSRSMEYFVDLNVFNFKIQSSLWKELELMISSRLKLGLVIIAYTGLYRLHQLPPGFLNTLIAVNPFCFGNLAYGKIKAIKFFRRIHDLCGCDDDVTNYKQLLRRWIYTQPLEYGVVYWQGTAPSQWPPYSHRYLAMAFVERYVTTEPCGRTALALRPETDFDAHETALWLHKLLHRIYREIYHNDIEEYNSLLQQWVSWAACNDIPLKKVDDLPNASWYLQRIMTEKRVASRSAHDERAR